MSGLRIRIGERIRENRIGRSMTQEELAERANVHPTYISQIERGVKSVTIDTLEKILSGLGVTLGELMKEIDGVHYQGDATIEGHLALMLKLNPIERDKLLGIVEQILSFR